LANDFALVVEGLDQPFGSGVPETFFNDDTGLGAVVLGLDDDYVAGFEVFHVILL
tara:strand:+ start:290 stop:454 length:165 start_codon:yes stop_codon:yes gene_type:complete